MSIQSIRELSSGHDQQLGALFRRMRETIRAPKELVAEYLKTSVVVVEALEEGAILALPHWGETERLVKTYAYLLQLDPGPILRRINQQLGSRPALLPPSPNQVHDVKPRSVPHPTPHHAPHPKPYALAGPPTTIPPAPRPRSRPAPRRQRNGYPVYEKPYASRYYNGDVDDIEPDMGDDNWRPHISFARILKWSAAIAVVGTIVLFSWSGTERSQVLWAAVDTLPEPIPAYSKKVPYYINAIWEYVKIKPSSANVDDPRLRKTDKLPVRGQNK